MYARMIVAPGQSERFAEAVRRVQDAVLPAAQEHPGDRGVLLTEHGQQQRVGLSVWASAAVQPNTQE